MATVGAILGVASSLLSAAGSVAGASHGPQGSQLAGGRGGGGFQYRPTTAGQDDGMRLNDLLGLQQQDPNQMRMRQMYG